MPQISRHLAVLALLGLAACATKTPVAFLADEPVRPFDGPVTLAGPGAETELDCRLAMQATLDPRIGARESRSEGPVGVAYHPLEDGAVRLAAAFRNASVGARMVPAEGRVVVRMDGDADRDHALRPAYLLSGYLGFLGGAGVYGRPLDQGDDLPVPPDPPLIALFQQALVADPAQSVYVRRPDAAERSRVVAGGMEIDGRPAVMIRTVSHQMTEVAPGVVRAGYLSSDYVTEEIYDTATGLPLRQQLDLTIDAVDGAERTRMVHHVSTMTCDPAGGPAGGDARTPT